MEGYCTDTLPEKIQCLNFHNNKHCVVRFATTIMNSDKLYF